MWHKTFAAIAAAWAASGCSGAIHQLPHLDQANLSMAQTEVQAAGGAPARHSVNDQEVMATLDDALKRIEPAATQVCREMAVGVCTWRFVKSNDHSLNAGAGPNGIIFVNRGVVEYATNEEEVAMVIAHEIGHQAANHVANGQRNQMIGAIVGALIGGAAGALASGNSRYSSTVTRSSANLGSSIGGTVGRISFSKEQEREADYLSAVILYRSGVDLDKAREILVIMARASGRKETGMLDTHPAGPERLAAWDKAVAEIRASKGALPKRAR
ncbi:MAG: M48 family metallopeptidase [Proteobacteria bacterium]|nr:M48 family metallopeptidase [Pseudomonadota bacterium]